MKKAQPAQQQSTPGTEEKMVPKPESYNLEYKAAGKFTHKVVVITGGDSGIGKAAAIAFAAEGAKVAIIYNSSDEDALKTKNIAESFSTTCFLVKGNIDEKSFCEEAVQQIVDELGTIDVLINNAGEQHPQKDIQDITEEQLQKTFQTNIFAMFFMTQAVLPWMKKG